MKFVMLATVAAIGFAAMATPSQATVLPPAKAGITSSAITQVACVWHRKRVWIARHVDSAGVVHRGHWIHRRVKVCD